MKVVALLVVVLAGLVLSACAIPQIRTLTGSGRIVQQELDLKDFDEVDISNAFKAEIQQGDTFQVVLETDDNLVDIVEVETRGDTLYVGLQRDTLFSISNATRNVFIIMPELVAIDASGASKVKVAGFESDEDLLVDASGASNIAGTIVAADVTVDASGSSEVNLSGQGEELEVDASGASDVDLASFPVNDAKVDASGSSSVTVLVGGRLDAEASGASDIRYLGNPTIGNIDTSGAGSIERQ